MNGDFSLKNILYVLLTLSFIALFIAAHDAAGLSMPIPWPDESTFLWQAVNFARHTTLYAPQINPERHILWMPPGFMIVYGFFQKIFGTSLLTARLFSLSFMSGAFLFLLGISRRTSLAPGGRFVSVVLCGLFFLNVNFTVAGNTARMEALLLFIVCAGFYFLQRERIIPGISLLFLSPLVHPNGVYFAAGGILYILIEKRAFFRRGQAVRLMAEGPAARIADYGLPLLLLLCWGGYMLYISFHWTEFQHDMQEQLRRKASRHVWDAIAASQGNLVLLFLIPALYAWTLWKKLPARFYFYILPPAWIIKKIGQESWYSVYDSLAYLLLCLAAVELAVYIARQFTPGRRLQASVALLSCVLAVILCYGAGEIEYPFVRDREWYSLGPEQKGVAYHSEDDKQKIRGLLDSLSKHDPYLEVQFFPEADVLLYQELESPSLVLRHPIYYEKVPDVYILHVSRYLPQWWRSYMDQVFRKVKVSPPEEGRFLFSRDSTEFWYYRMVDPAKKKEYEKIRW